jgi:hypothetical protein
MYELKKIGKVFTSKFVGTGPSSYKKNNLPGHDLTKVQKPCCRGLQYKTEWYGSIKHFEALISHILITEKG